MTTITYPYQTHFAKPVFQKVFGGICLLLVVSGALSFLFQLTIEQSCHTKAMIIFLSSMFFWGISGIWISELSKKNHFLSLILLTGAGVLVLNQIFVRASVDYSLYFIYNCRDVSADWLNYIFANNLIINVLCYTGFVGYGYWEARQSQESKLQSTDNQAITNHYFQPKLTENDYQAKISFKNGSEIQWIATKDILWIESDNNCVVFFTLKQKFVSYQTLKSLECVLNPAEFVRIHRSTILNKNHIHKIINLPSGDALVEVSKGEKLRVSRTYKKNLFN
jgi:hypothetical protein